MSQHPNSVQPGGYDPHERSERDTEAARARRLYWTLGVLLLAAVVAFGAWRTHKKRLRTRFGGPTVAAASPSGSGDRLGRLPIAGQGTLLALEVWIKSPEAVGAKILPRLMGPTPPFVPTFAQLMKTMMVREDGTPNKEAQADIEEIDFDKPLAYVLLDSGPPTADGKEAPARFVLAAVVKDPARAKTVVEAYARREGATKEHSDALAVDVYKGAKTGRYLALFGDQVMLAADRPALETTARRIREGLPVARTQANDIAARAPRDWVTGPFAKAVEKRWVDWSNPQLGGASTGPAKALFDEMASGARTTFTGAEDVVIVLDVDARAAHATVTLRAGAGTPFSTFLDGYPAGPPEPVLWAPRDALGAMAMRFPREWLETVRRFVTTAPPGVEVPEEVRVRTETVFRRLASALEGEVVIASVADPPPYGGPGASLMRFKVRDDEEAKRAAHDLAKLALPPELTKAPAVIEGGAGEAMEVAPAAQAGQPPMPIVGLAWLVKAGHLYVVRGATPKVRVIRFADSKTGDHLDGDPDLRARVAKLPARSAAVVVIAPARVDTPLHLAMRIPPMAEAVTLALETTAQGLVLHGDFDLDLTLHVLLPMFVQPVLAGQPPAGALPPDAAMGMPPTAGSAPSKPAGGAPRAGAGAPAGGGVKPPIYIPPAPTGYVLPLPKPKSAD